MAKEIKELQGDAVQNVVQHDVSEGMSKCCEPIPTEASILWNKQMVANLTILDKIIDGLENGSNIEHCLMLSQIYHNLCN